jgi:cell wall-associated NlpC family hydrolase
MRKNVLRTLLAAALMSTCFGLSAYADSAVVTGSEVNLRSGPGTNYRVIDCLSLGTGVTVTDRSNDSWYAVDYNGQSGFMSAAYLNVSETSYAADTTVSGDNASGYINAMYVRFRSGPSSDASILGEYNRGKALTITGTNGDWTACTIDGQSGYVYSQYVSTAVQQASSSTQVSSSVDIYLSPFVGGDSYQSSVETTTPVYPDDSTATPAPTETPAATAAPVATVVPTATPVPVHTATPVESKSGYINGDYVRFRTGPSTSYSIIDSYNKGTSLTITGTSGDWTECTINGVSGYVYSKYVTESSTTGSDTVVATPTPTETPVETVTQTTGYIVGNNVRMRSGASMSSNIITELFYGNSVTITGTSGDWTAVIYDGTSGFVYSQYVKEGSYSTGSTGSTDSSTGSTDSSTGSTDSSGTVTGSTIAEYALQFVGYNYTWGGKSPDTGFDCSGLVYYVYQQFGYNLNRVAADQATNGIHVDSSDLQPGDLLAFYSSGSYIGHIGIYIGNNMFVHAANSSTGVIVSALEGSYASRGYEARRIIY